MQYTITIDVDDELHAAAVRHAAHASCGGVANFGDMLAQAVSYAYKSTGSCAVGHWTEASQLISIDEE